ncbi:DUF3800 domain-containing protein [Actinosynnema sp.]|uniref:DUF3800 domain-containing protein n=1 Tax=Actinosynnema sp. TaxID=1872144 RepID=UPI003F851982
MHQVNPTTPALRAYVDETGDRGFGPSASRLFGLCAVLVPDELDHELRRTVRELRTGFGIPEGHALHWADHLRARNHDRRRHAAKSLSEVPGVQLIYVLVDKRALAPASDVHGDAALTYTRTTQLLFERIAVAARTWPGGHRRVIAEISHTRGHDHPTTLKHIGALSPHDGFSWRLATSKITIRGAADRDGLQAADLYLGMFNAAITPDKYGNHSDEYLVECLHQVHRDPLGRMLGRGFTVLGQDSLITGQPWWPSSEGRGLPTEPEAAASTEAEGAGRPGPSGGSPRLREEP